MSETASPKRLAPVPVAFPFIGDLVGGSHISALNLIKHFDPNRFSAKVLIDIGDGPVADLFQKEDIPFEVISKRTLGDGRPKRRRGAMLRYGIGNIQRLTRHLRRDQIRLLHSNDGRMHVFGSIASRLAGARHVWHHRSDPKASSLRWMSPIGADHLVTVSRFAGPKPGWWSAAKKWTVVPSPFPTEMRPPRDACRQEMVEALGVPPETLIVSFFGNLVSRKRPFDFVRAIAAFRAAYPSSPIVAPIFGKPQAFSIADIEAFAREQGVADCVRLMGFRYPPERWLAGSDILFVPSVREPFGRTLIEAMIVGTVVVAVDSGGNPEAIDNGETGYLIPVEDPVTAASTFRDIAADRQAARRVADRAQAEAQKRFGMRRHADAIMTIYDHVLSGHPQTTPSGLAVGAAHSVS